MSWVEVEGAGWSWVEVDGAGWSWVHGLVIPKRKLNTKKITSMSILLIRVEYHLNHYLVFLHSLAPADELNYQTFQNESFRQSAWIIAFGAFFIKSVSIQTIGATFTSE